MVVEHENSAKRDLGSWQARVGEEKVKDFKTPEADDSKMNTCPLTSSSFRTHHEISVCTLVCVHACLCAFLCVCVCVCVLF